jgi:hypothetical protein
MTEKIEEKRKHDRRAGDWDFDFLAMIFTFAAVSTIILNGAVASVLGIISCALWIAGYCEKKIKN